LEVYLHSFLTSTLNGGASSLSHLNRSENYPYTLKKKTLVVVVVAVSIIIIIIIIIIITTTTTMMMMIYNRESQDENVRYTN